MDLFFKDSLLGEHIRSARILKGLSQQQLAEKLKCSRQYVHQIENGIRPLSDTLSEQVKEVLDLKEEYGKYHISPKFDVSIDQVNFCRRKGATTVEIERARLVSSLYLHLIDNVENWINFPDEKISFFASEYLPKNSIAALDIERLAEKIRLFYKIDLDSPLSNTIRLVENSGAVVVKIPEFSDKISAFSVSGRRPLIALNESSNAYRNRFKTLHEYGHLILGKNEGLENEQIEKQVDHFAAAMLLPRSAFKNDFLKCYREFSRFPFDWNAIYALKKKWKVSVQAILHRAFFLNLISQENYTKAYKYLAKNGQLKNEIGDDELKAEEAEILTSALEMLYEHKSVNFSQLVYKLPYKKDFLRNTFGFKNADWNLEEEDNLVVFMS